MMEGSPFLDGVAGSLSHAALFILLSLACAIATTAVLKRTTGANFIELGQGDPVQQLLAKAGLFVAFVALPSAMIAALFGEPAAAFGLSMHDIVGYISGGLLFGGALLSAICLLIAVLARSVLIARPTPDVVGAMRLATNLLLWAAGAFIEEATFRGYSFIQLYHVWGFWPAALLSCAVFTAIHWPRPKQSRWGGVFAAVSGLMLCHSVILFGSLWFAIAFHAAWNFFQSYVFGVNNSGGPPPAAFRSWSFAGPQWLTGGQVGPEGSVLATILLATGWVAVLSIAA